MRKFTEIMLGLHWIAGLFVVYVDTLFEEKIVIIEKALP